MKNLLKIKSIVTLMIVTALIALAFITRNETVITVLTTAFAAAIGSLFAKPESK